MWSERGRAYIGPNRKRKRDRTSQIKKEDKGPNVVEWPSNMMK
jgi:hypothetical protein